MSKIAQITSYPITIVFYLLFGLMLLIFDVAQRISLFAFGYQAHKKVVDIFNGTTVLLLRLMGTKFTFKDNSNLPKDLPILLVSNHQSMWDIPPIIWSLRRFHPKFVSKKELGKGIPTISFNLKHGGSVLIDRKDREQATAQLEHFAKYLMKTHRSGVIFAEGTRSRDNTMRPFRPAGLTTLIENMPGAYIVLISITNSWKLQRYGTFPIPLGVHFKLIAHPAIKIEDQPIPELIQKVETTVRNGIS